MEKHQNKYTKIILYGIVLLLLMGSALLFGVLWGAEKHTEKQKEFTKKQRKILNEQRQALDSIRILKSQINETIQDSDTTLHLPSIDSIRAKRR